MLLSIEPDGPVPIYQQIRDRIVEAIAAGEVAVGSGLPSTRQLAVDLGINFHTVNKAYDQLRQEGLLRIGRKAGAGDNFDYSAAMKNSGIVWNDENLTKYLMNPSKFLPGNKMAFPGIKNDQEIADLLAYLRQATQ